jgi:hypothetical protein
MILRVLAAVVALILGTGAALILITTSPGGTPDGSPARPYPSVTPYPGGWKP